MPIHHTLRQGPEGAEEGLGVLRHPEADGRRAVFTPKRGSSRRRDEKRSMRETGPLRLLDRCAEGTPRPLERRFPTAGSRYTPLKNAATLYGKFEPVRDRRPQTSADTPSLVLRTVGSDRGAQLLFFKDTVPD